jgi:hypothetical protein
MKYQHTPIRTAKMKVIAMGNDGKDTQKLYHSFVAGRDVK